MHRRIDKKNMIAIYLLLLFTLSTINGKFIENKEIYSSSINKINIEGLSNVNNSKIYNQLKNLLYKNILLIKKKEIQNVISNYNIVEKYNIKKIYPSTININIIPTKFVARLSNNDQLVGANGKLIKDNINDKILPYIFGEYNSQEFLNFKNNIEKSEFIFTEFKTLFFFPSKRWDILTNNDVLIKLPKDNLSESINLAYKIMNNINFKDKNLIDLRMRNHLIIK